MKGSLTLRNFITKVFFLSVLLCLVQVSSAFSESKESTNEPLNIKTEQEGSGIILNDGKSGEIFGGKRWAEGEDPNQWLTLKTGDGGIRIVSADNKNEFLAIDNFGGIYLNGDFYLNGEKLENKREKFNNSLLIIGSIFLIILSFMLLFHYKMRKEIETLKSKLDGNN